MLKSWLSPAAVAHREMGSSHKRREPMKSCCSVLGSSVLGPIFKRHSGYMLQVFRKDLKAFNRSFVHHLSTEFEKVSSSFEYIFLKYQTHCWCHFCVTRAVGQKSHFRKMWMCASIHPSMACVGVKIPQKSREQLWETAKFFDLWDGYYILQEHYVELKPTAGKFGFSVPKPALCLPAWKNPKNILLHKWELLKPPFHLRFLHPVPSQMCFLGICE